MCSAYDTKIYGRHFFKINFYKYITGPRNASKSARTSDR